MRVSKLIMRLLCCHMGRDWATLKQFTRLFFSSDVTQSTCSREQADNVLETGSVMNGDVLNGWRIISGLSPVSIVTCWRHNCRTCFCESQNLQSFSRNFPGSNFISDTGCPDTVYVAFHSPLRQMVGYGHMGITIYLRVFSKSSFPIIVSFDALRYVIQSAVE